MAQRYPTGGNGRRPAGRRWLAAALLAAAGLGLFALVLIEWRSPPPGPAVAPAAGTAVRGLAPSRAEPDAAAARIIVTPMDQASARRLAALGLMLMLHRPADGQVSLRLFAVGPQVGPQ